MRTFAHNMLSLLHRHSSQSCWALQTGISDGILELISICRITKLYIEWILLASGRASWWDNNVIEKVCWILSCMLSGRTQVRIQLRRMRVWNSFQTLITLVEISSANLIRRRCEHARECWEIAEKYWRSFLIRLNPVCTLLFFIYLWNCCKAHEIENQ